MSEAFYEAMKEGKILKMSSKQKAEYLKHHWEDFSKSGLSLITLRKAGYESISEEIIDDGYDVRGRKKRKKLTGHWKVPITNPFNREVYYYRKKLDESIKEEKGKEIFYVSPKDSKPHLYFSLQIKNWKGIIDNSTIPIIITEGEKKADKLIQEEYIAVGISGVWCWSQDKEPVDDLKLLLKGNRTFKLVLDSDYKTNPKVQEALKRLKKVIEAAGCKAIDCSLPGPEKGVDDALVKCGKEWFEKHLQTCIEQYKEVEEYNGKVEQVAWNYLRNPNLIDEFLSDMKKLGIIGEEENLVRIYFCCLSYKFDSCLGLILKGATSSGKTTIMKKVTDLMPEGVVSCVSSQSEQALNYWTDIAHTIIVITEEKPPDDKFWEVMSSWRQLIEDNEITRIIVDHNEKDINKKRKEIKIKGPIVYLSTTTQANLHEENENRLFVFHTDDSQEHIGKVIQGVLEEEDDENLESEEQFIIAKHRKAVELLQPFKWNQIKMPFKKKINLNPYRPEAMRDIKKLIKFTKIITYLYQYQQEEPSTNIQLPVTDWRKESIENYDPIQRNNTFRQSSPVIKELISTIAHFNLAVDYTKEYFDANSSDMSKDLQDKWNKIYKFSGDDSIFTYSDCVKKWNLKKSRVQQLVKEMLDKNMVVEVEKTDEEFDEKQKKKKQFRCIAWNISSSGLDKIEPYTVENITGGKTNSKELPTNSPLNTSTSTKVET